MLQICADCTCPYSHGAPRCPHCRSVRFRWQGEEDGPIRSAETGEVAEEVPEEQAPTPDKPASAARSATARNQPKV